MQYVVQLSKDKKLKKLITAENVFTLKKRLNLPLYLCSSIMSQQLSIKVAAVLQKRFFQLYGSRKPTPLQILSTTPEKLREIGLSNAKAGYIHNICRFSIEHGISWRQLNKMDNEAVINYLTQIKGVGRWTVEMLLMFALQREDVFSTDDLGIQEAMKKMYRLEALDKKMLRVRMLEIAEKWVPYRTYACLHLWHWKNQQ